LVEVLLGLVVDVVDVVDVVEVVGVVDVVEGDEDGVVDVDGFDPPAVPK
jgi:hypothetical protein